MTELVFGALVTILVAAVPLISVALGYLIKRLDRLEETNHKLWAYCRQLLDMYYRYRRPESPDPPELPEID